MPEPTRFSKPRQPKEEEEDNLPVPVVQGEITVPQCHTCTSPHRRAVEKMIALGTSYAEISRMVGIDRRSIAGHAKDHLNYEEAAIKRIIEEEVKAANENAEEGIRGITRRRIFLESIIQKSMEALTNGDIELTNKDAMTAIDMLNKLDTNVQGVELETIRIQFNAFMQAMKDLLTPELHQAILDRTRELVNETVPMPVEPKRVGPGESD